MFTVLSLRIYSAITYMLSQDLFSGITWVGGGGMEVGFRYTVKTRRTYKRFKLNVTQCMIAMKG